MTATRKKKAAPKRRVSAAESRRQEEAKANSKLDTLTALVEKSLAANEALSKRVEDLSKMPTQEQALAQHDQSERVINDVLRYDVVEDQFPELPEENKAIPGHLAAMGKRLDALNNPVSMEKVETDAGLMPIGQYEERPQESTGPARGSLAELRAQEPGIAGEMTQIMSKEKYEIELFMHENVLIRVHETTDETQVDIPESINNGRKQFYIRGKMQWVRRYSIEPLARAKKTTYTQRKIRDVNNVEKYINTPHTALMYPFEVLKDTDRGKAWLRNILSEAY